MFGTILKEVSGYFDKTALITAFFPSLIFWAATLILVVDQRIGWSAGIEQWEGWSGTLQGIILIAFFAWVTFWSFLTINFRPLVIRLYEGYWSEVNPVVAAIKELMRRSWKQRWDKLDRKDRDLEKQIIPLQEELRAWKQLGDSSINLPPDSSVDIEQAKQEVRNVLTQAKKKLLAWNKKTFLVKHDYEEIKQLREKVLSCWEKVMRFTNSVPENETNIWVKYSEEITKFVQSLAEKLTQQKVELEEQRERINGELFRYYPTKRAEIMPTLLGNVLKASEMYAGERYNLDTVLIWPRLLPNLPQEFVESLSSAKVSLDLMVTLSAYILLFGLPLTAWLALKSSAMLPAILPVFIAIIAIIFQFNLLLIPLILAFVLTSKLEPFIEVFLPQLQVFLILATSVLLAARLTYQNAVQAAVYYGEQIKTAFDLYRWKALEGLNLQLPPNLEEERKLWEAVCGLLYRSYLPDSNYYRYVKQTNTKEPTPESPHLVRLPVPARTLPAYRSIVADDIVEKEMPEAQITTDTVRQGDECIGRCPLQPLPANQPISHSALVEQKYLMDTIALGIQATPAMTLGGRLKAGDIVDIKLLSDGGATYNTSLNPIIWEDILILDVRSVTAPESGKLADCQFVIVIALPKTLEMQFAMASPQTRWLIASKC